MTDQEINDAIAAAEKRVTDKMIAAVQINEDRSKAADVSLNTYTKSAHDRITKVVNELKKANSSFPTI